MLVTGRAEREYFFCMKVYLFTRDMRGTEDDIEVFSRHSELLEEEKRLFKALGDHRAKSKDAMVGCVSSSSIALLTHRRIGDELAQKLQDVQAELDIVDRLIVLRFREGKNKMLHTLKEHNDRQDLV